MPYQKFLRTECAGQVYNFTYAEYGCTGTAVRDLDDVSSCSRSSTAVQPYGSSCTGSVSIWRRASSATASSHAVPQCLIATKAGFIVGRCLRGRGTTAALRLFFSISLGPRRAWSSSDPPPDSHGCCATALCTPLPTDCAPVYAACDTIV
jgi:hypothetical protein